MADIRINQLPASTGGSAPVATDNIAIDGASTRKATIQQVVDTGAPIATQSEAQTGTNATKRMTPLTTKQSIASEVGVTLASADQGALADSALQPGEAATPAQGAKADAALPSANKADQIQAEAGTNDTNYSTPLRVSQTIDGRSTKLFGSGSVSRTIPARFGDTLDLRDFFDSTGGAGTDTVNNSAMTALISYLIANPSIRTLVGHAGDVHRFSGTTTRVIPSGVRLMADGARFDWSGDFSGGAGSWLQFSSGCDVTGLSIRVLSGSSFRRFVDFLTDNVVSDFDLYAESQINNNGGSLLDYAVRYYGNNQRITRSRITNIDYAHLGYGNQGDATPGMGHRYYGCEAISYCNGMNLRNLKDVHNNFFSAKTRSINSAPDPGNNALLHGAIQEYVLSNFNVREAREHGVRFGGSRGTEPQSRDITVSGGNIIRSGQSGLKFFNGIASQRFTNVNVSSVNIVDCQYEPESPGELPGFNDEGVLAQQIANASFTGITVSQKDNPTGFSSDCCFFFTGCTNIVAAGLYGDKPRRNFIRLSEWDDGAGSAPVETLAQNGIVISSAFGTNVGQDGVLIDHPTQSLRDLHIQYSAYGTNAAGFYGFRTNAAVARYAQPSLIEYKTRNFQAGAINLASSGNMKLRDLFGSTY